MPPSVDDAMSPAYLLVAEAVAGDISTRPTGWRVPSEHELMAHHGVSRVTARAALQELEARWLVRRVRGAGTFVAHRLDLALGTGSDTDPRLAAEQGGAPHRVEVVSVRARRPLAQLREELELDPDERTVTVVESGEVDSVPAWHTTTHLPAEVVDGLVDHVESGSTIHQLLREVCGLTPARSWLRAEQLPAPGDVVDALALEGRPMLWCIERGDADASLGRPVARSTSWVRPDVFRVRVELGAQR